MPTHQQVGQPAWSSHLAGSIEDCAAVLELVADGTVSSRLTPVSFDEIGGGLERLQRGEVVGRLVAMLD